MKDRNSGRCAHCQNAEQETCQTQRSRCEIRAGVPSEACHAVTFRVSAVPPSGFGRCMRPCPLFDVTGERQLGCSLRRVPGVARKPRPYYCMGAVLSTSAQQHEDRTLRSLNMKDIMRVIHAVMSLAGCQIKKTQGKTDSGG